MNGTSHTAADLERVAVRIAQAPIAGAAIFKHCLRYRLRAPHTMTLPTYDDDKVTLYLDRGAATPWVNSIAITDEHNDPTDTGLLRTTVTGYLPDSGITVHLRFVRPVPLRAVEGGRA